MPAHPRLKPNPTAMTLTLLISFEHAGQNYVVQRKIAVEEYQRLVGLARGVVLMQLVDEMIKKMREPLDKPQARD